MFRDKVYDRMAKEIKSLRQTVTIDEVAYPLTAELDKDDNWVKIAIRFPDNYPPTPFYQWANRRGSSMAELEVLRENHTIWILTCWVEILDHPALSKEEHRIAKSIHRIMWLLLISKLKLDDLMDHFMVRVEACNAEDSEFYRKLYHMKRINSMNSIIMEAELTNVLAELN